MTTPDPPYYTRELDGNSRHVCQKPGHVRYWLNVAARLWVCAVCHPPVGAVPLRVPAGLVEVVELKEIRD